VNGAIRIVLSPLSGGEPFTVVAGMVEARKWERKNGRSVAKELDSFAASALVELAHLAYCRRHADVSIEDFENRFDVGIDTEGAEPLPDPSDPATDPSSD
jgi:hypothetical protein